ncbi:unnamed protein product [Parascedosporium putredinis]|uniref:Cyclin-D1-binding protein 1-like N-terminal domain-containing protein n=1 Tax=Parascedosporium putredinis TaxID=1442378 RepID=A0A9P1MA69_9PEZI|nr:unnamed protein product [Parascedosporium putredinis]CAI7992207.1 unnamed protein product [Parascedosporium putredinis]
MAPDAQQDPTITELNALVSSVAALLTQLEATLTGLTKETEASKVSASSSSEPVVAAGTGNTQIDCLKLAADSADLIRAHTTRLSLLIITEPFTPTAIGKVLRELVSGAVPSLATAAELCDGERFTYFFSQAMRVKCHSLMRELRAFVQRSPRTASLAMTGVLWSICDDLKRFATGGVGPYLVKRIEETRLTLKDIVEELTEWQEESEEQDDDDDDDDEDGGNAADFDSAVDINDSRANSMQAQGLHDNAQELLDDLMGSAKTIPGMIPKGPTAPRPVPPLAQALHDYNGEITASLQRVFTFLNTLPQKYEDVVLAFYDLDTATVDENLKKAGVGLIGAIEPLKTPFNEQDSDEFTTWFGKFKTELETAYSSQY